MNKYYTPTIEEFHVGFEFLAKDLHDNLVDETLRPEKMDENRSLRIISDWLKNDEIRVKHLDREDIESFGFEGDVLFPGKDNLNRLRFHKEVETHKGKELVNIIYIPQTNWTLFYMSPINKEYGGYVLEMPENKLTIAGGTVFAGTLKNKSEFKRVLNQIGII